MLIEWLMSPIVYRCNAGFRAELRALAEQGCVPRWRGGGCGSIPRRRSRLHLPTPLAQCELPADLVAAVAELTELKSRTREMGSGAVPAPIAPGSSRASSTARQHLSHDPAIETWDARGS